VRLSRILAAAMVLSLATSSLAAPKRAKLTKAEKAKLPRVAVLDFPTPPDAVSCGGWGNHQAQMSDVIRDIFTTEILDRAHGKLRLVERARLKDVKGELDLQQSGDVDAATAQKVGKLLGAKYMLTGKITRFACKVSGAKSGWGVGKLVGKVTKDNLAGDIAGSLEMKKVKFSGRLDARLIEVETGEILLAFKDDSETSDVSAKVAGGGSEVQYDDELASKVFEPIVAKMASKVVKRTVQVDEENQEEEEEEEESEE
jgi:curli biogenesis system outer membrane secretion channel CsgG